MLAENIGANLTAGDVFISDVYETEVPLHLLLHEIGHSLGLKHPHEGEIQLTAAEDNGTYTVMSFNQWEDFLGAYDADAARAKYGPAAFKPSTTGGLEHFAWNEAARTLTERWGEASSTIVATSFSDSIDAGAGDDSVGGFDGNDTLLGGDGADRLFGGKGDDTLIGGAGDDYIEGTEGNYEGGGSDTVSFAGVSAPVWADLGPLQWNGVNWANARSAETGDDQMWNIDNAIGGSGADALTGNVDANRLDGGDGADVLVGKSGNDTLDGGTNPELGEAGAQGDILLGGEGDDTYHVDSGLDLVDEGIYFAGYGFGGVDIVISTADFWWDVGSVGEIIRVDEAVNDVGGDGVTVVGGLFSNTMEGHAGTDIFFGRGGSDTYRGGDGVDWYSLSLLGTEGAYDGVNGVNTIIVEQRTTGAFSYDIVFEFESGKDRLDLSNYAEVNYLANGADAFALAHDDGAGNCYFVLGDGFDYLYMVGVEKADLAAGDFVV